MIKNTYKCSSRIWRKLSEKGKQIFNSVMLQSLKNQTNTSHPNMLKMSTRQWETMCYNFACYAAWAHDKSPIIKGTEIIDIDPKTKKAVRIRKAA